MKKILCIKCARLSHGHIYPDNCVVHFFQFEVDLINWLAYHLFDPGHLRSQRGAGGGVDMAAGTRHAAARDCGGTDSDNEYVTTSFE